MGYAMAGTTIRWFGPSWGAPICQPHFQVPWPHDCECVCCGKEFEMSHQGVRLPHLSEPGHVGFSHFHLGCFLVSVGVLDEGMQFRPLMPALPDTGPSDLHPGPMSDTVGPQDEATVLHMPAPHD